MRGHLIVNLKVRPVPDTRNLTDPRPMIATHIGWEKKQGPVTEWSVPEPDNYNRALYADKMLICEHLEHQVTYKCKNTSRWWTVYYVPKNRQTIFEAWVEKQAWLVRWNYEHAPSPRDKKKILTPDNIRADITLPERLFAMGYYAKLHDKYFSDGTDDWLLSQMGPIRDCVLNDPSEV